MVEEGGCVVMWLELGKPGSKSQRCYVTGVRLSFLCGKMGMTSGLLVGIKGGQANNGPGTPWV